MLKDLFGRPVDYMRVAVTDRCNLRCVYCMPPEGIEWKRRDQILTYEEIALVVRVAAGLGIRKVRLTGGEPLVRPHLERLVEMVAATPGIEDVSLTTNAVLLDKRAAGLASAGLRRVNVSLDTLRPERFQRITRFGQLDDVWRGIDAAERAGLSPLKINAVAVRGMNDDELLDFAALTLEHDWHVRFIELMPVSNEGDWGEHLPPPGNRLVTMSEMQAAIAARWGSQAMQAPGETALPGNGPARMVRLPGARGTLGFISPVSQHFCPACNRIRLTADGRLRPCLLADGEVDVMAALRSGRPLAEIERLVQLAVENKPQGHRLDEAVSPLLRVMAQIGG